MRSFTIFLAFLLTIIYVTLAEDNNYEEFLPSGDPSESEWTSGNLVTATNTDLVDAGLFEDPLESYDQQPGQDIASTGGGCSSGGKQTPDILRPRGVDDSCGSNLGPDERPLVVPNIFTMNLEVLCPNKFGELAVNLVCASETAANTQPTIMGTTLLECELGVFLVFLKILRCVK